MKFAIVGPGNVGTAIARGVTAAGHDVVVAGPSEESLEAVAGALPIGTTTSNREAVTGADIVVLAVPFDAAYGIATELRGELADKIVIDVTNPLTPDYAELATQGESAAELIQRAAPDAHVVKAFNTVFAANQSAGAVNGTQLDAYVAGDDAQAKNTVVGLVQAIGFRAIDVGELKLARNLEAMAVLNITLNARNGWSWQSGWKLVGPLS